MRPTMTTTGLVIH